MMMLFLPFRRCWSAIILDSEDPLLMMLLDYLPVRPSVFPGKRFSSLLEVNPLEEVDIP